MLGTRAAGSAMSAQTIYQGYRVAVYRHPSDQTWGFSVFAGGGVPGQKLPPLMARKGYASADAAAASAKKAVDLVKPPSFLGGLDGFSFGSISKLFSKVGEGVADNAGVIGTVGGAVLTATGVGAPAGMALAAAGGAVQAKENEEKAKKAADAASKAAAGQADATAATADATVAAAAATPGGKGGGKKPIWPWLAAGGGVLVLVLGISAMLLLRKKQ